MARETWYVLEDGSNVDPSEVAPDDKGVLRNKSGVAVGYGAHGNPKSRSVDVEEERKKVKAAEQTERQVKAEGDGAPKYKTRVVRKG